MRTKRPARRALAVLGVLVAATLLLAACGGDASDAGGSEASATEATATSTTTATVAPAPATAAPAPSAVAEPAVAPAVEVAPRGDGLTGAPVPAPEAESAAFDAERVNVRAGSFPPLDYPRVVAAAEATWLRPESLVLGALRNGEARAYPLSMMTFHHVANDELGGEPYLATF